MYELATAALRSSEVTAALSMVCRRAIELNGVDRFALAAMDFGQPVALAGGQLSPDELKQAAWSYENARPVGITVRDGAVKLMRTHPGVPTPSYLPLASGVAVVGIDAQHAEPDELRMLAALIGLADLLLDRRRASLEAERARGFEASDRLKAAILSSLSHELKSPIASLRAGITALATAMLNARRRFAAAVILAAHPEAMQLRYLSTLNTLASEKTTTIVFPFPMNFGKMLSLIAEHKPAA